LSCECDLLRESGNSQFRVQRAHQVFPGQIVEDEGNGSGERKNVSSESWNGKIQQAGCDHAQRSQQEWQQRAVDAKK